MKLVINDGKIGKGLKFNRLRRVTGYITGDYKTRFNESRISETESRQINSLTSGYSSPYMVTYNSGNI